MSSWCLVTVSALWLFLTVQWVGLQCVAVVFPDHTYFFQKCEKDWQMMFNSDKSACAHIQITNKRKMVIQTSLNIPLPTLKETTISESPLTKLSWNSHVDQVTKNANQTTAFLCRNLSSCSKVAKPKCYIVRPQLEYAATICLVPISAVSMPLFPHQ